MTIAFGFLNPAENQKANFIVKIFQQLSTSHPEHTFIFITNKMNLSFSGIENVKFILIEGKINNWMSVFLWYNIKVTQLLKKHKADIFITQDVCSFFTTKPQIVVVDKNSFSHDRYTSQFKSIFGRLLFSGSVKKADSLVFFSHTEKEVFEKKFARHTACAGVIFYGAPGNIMPASFDEREKIKEKIADGNEYFFYAGTLSSERNFINLLRAFSFFKKRQRSTMQLVFAGARGKNYEGFIRSMSNYKFKNDIKIYDDLSKEKILEICSSAYAMIDPGGSSSNYTAVFASMKSAVPVLIALKSPLAEVCSFSAIYFDAANYKDIAEKMMDIFRDEDMKKNLVCRAASFVEGYTWQKSSEAMWKLIQQKSLKPCSAQCKF